MIKAFSSNEIIDREYLRAKSRPYYEDGKRSLRLVDMFAGAGGITLGVAEACRLTGHGLSVQLAIEADPKVWPVYAANFCVPDQHSASAVDRWVDRLVGSRLSLIERRSRRMTGAVDILAGGPPCQGHSNLNNHTRGDDPKNQLYMSMVRAVEVFEPEYLLIENVPSIANDRSKVVNRATANLQRLGYSVVHGVVCAADFGVPQMRNRHLLVASRSASLPDTLLAAPTKSPPRTVRWAIADLLRKKTPGLVGTLPALSEANLSRARWLLRNDKYDLPNRLRPRCHRDDPDHRYKSMYGRLHWDLPAQTITTGFRSPGQGRFLHPAECRVLTGREAARLQFFPDWFDFEPACTTTNLAVALGNAVPPRIVTRMIVDILRARESREIRVNAN